MENMDADFASFSRSIVTKLIGSDLTTDFEQQTTDERRVATLLDSDMILESIRSYIRINYENGGKDEEKAIIYKEKARLNFDLKLYTDALENYTKSLLHSTDMNTVSICYANRSAVLIRMKQYRPCLVNIALSFDHLYPDQLHYKLHDRRGQCYIMLGQNEHARMSFEMALKYLPRSNLDDRRSDVWRGVIEKRLNSCHQPMADVHTKHTVDEDFISTVDKTNETFLSLSASCTVAYSENAGRFIQATKDIFPGEILVVERPYASILLSTHYWTHCHNCDQFTYSSVPIECCANVVFCSMACKSEAVFYHHYECNIMSSLSKAGVGKFGMLALRCLSKTNAAAIEKASAGNCDDMYKVGCNEDGKYIANTYNTIYNLVGHSKDRDVKDLLNKTLLAIYISILLECYSFYVTDMSTNVRAAAAILLRHLQSLPCNAHEISEFRLDEDDVAQSISVEVGAGIFSTLSLFNHSCDPSVTRNFTHGNRCVVRAIKTIHVGAEVCDNYGTLYATHTFDARQRMLRDHYFFNCFCTPCTDDWPIYQHIPIKPSSKCHKCGVHIKGMDWNMSSYVCTHCAGKNNFKSAFTALGKHQLNYMTAFKNIMLCEYEEAQKVLLNYITDLDKYVALPYQPYNNCQEGLKQCFNMQGNCQNVTNH